MAIALPLVAWYHSAPSSWQGVAEQVWLMTLTSLSDSKRQHPTPAFDMIVFGGTGDLAMRKLMPSLMHRDIDGWLHPASRIVGIGRSPIGNEGFAKRVEESCRNVIGPAFTEQSWAIFVRRLHYIALNGSKRNDYGVLRDFLDDSAPSGQVLLRQIKHWTLLRCGYFTSPRIPICLGP